MGKLTDRTQERIEQRSPEEGVRELHDCIAAANACMQVLAMMFPGCTFLAGIDRGQPCDALVWSRSQEFSHFLPEAMASAMRLAKVVASLPPDEIRDVFEIESRTVRECKKIRAEMERAVTAALVAADEKRSE
jgi:hypothetical protein